LPQCAPVASEVGERDKRCCFVEELGAVVRPLDLIEVEGVLAVLAVPLAQAYSLPQVAQIQMNHYVLVEAAQDCEGGRE
tara:strand:- start:131 stop:367 length:237 start_codon:yes stop_codon:yes gene_type:complete